MCICMFTQHLKPSPRTGKNQIDIRFDFFIRTKTHSIHTEMRSHDYWLISEMRECVRISDMQCNSNKLKTNRTIFCFVYLQLSYVERCETCFQYHKNFSNYNGVQCYTHARKFAHSIRLKLMFLLFFSSLVLYSYFAIAKCDVCVCWCVCALVVETVYAARMCLCTA